jgi:hypothetical protein
MLQLLHRQHMAGVVYFLILKQVYNFLKIFVSYVDGTCEKIGKG